jgi:hypothetical protein
MVVSKAEMMDETEIKMVELKGLSSEKEIKMV